jgi:integrase
MQAQPSPKRVRVAPNLWQNRTGRYELIKSVDGRQIQKTLNATTLTEAKRELREMLVGLERGTVASPSRITYGEVAAEFLAGFESLVLSGSREPESLELYRRRFARYLEPRLGRVPVQKVTARHLSDLYRAMRAQGLSENTLSSVARLNSSIEDLAMTRGYIAERPSKKLARAERPQGRNKTQARVLSAEEGRALVTATGPAWQPFVELLLGTGCRLGEALGLTWADVDLQEGIVHVRQQRTPEGRVKQPKAGGVREIEILPELVSTLRAHRLASPFSQEQDFVFQGDHRSAARAVRRAGDKAGLNDGQQPVSPHDARHSAISRWIACGLDLVTVQRLAGHKSAKTTLDRYAHAWERTRRSSDIRSKMALAVSV